MFNQVAHLLCFNIQALEKSLHRAQNFSGRAWGTGLQGICLSGFLTGRTLLLKL